MIGQLSYLFFVICLIKGLAGKDPTLPITTGSDIDRDLTETILGQGVHGRILTRLSHVIHSMYTILCDFNFHLIIVG